MYVNEPTGCLGAVTDSGEMRVKNVCAWGMSCVHGETVRGVVYIVMLIFFLGLLPNSLGSICSVSTSASHPSKEGDVEIAQQHERAMRQGRWRRHKKPQLRQGAGSCHRRRVLQGSDQGGEASEQHTVFSAASTEQMYEQLVGH